MQLDLQLFRDINAERAEQGFRIYKNVALSYWTTALAGEVGELYQALSGEVGQLCNMIKKMERVSNGGIDGGTSYKAADISKEKLKEEIGDIFTYLDLLAGLLGIDMAEAIITTFNSKSAKYGFTQFIPG
jgi:NTP pyrophosphatase (non-canonical NTP hydrolase)